MKLIIEESGAGPETPPPSLMLGPVTVPGNLQVPEDNLNNNDFETMSFSFPSGIDPGLDGVEFTLEIALFNEGAYAVRNLQLANMSLPVLVRGIRIGVNGTFLAQEAAYLNIDRILSPPEASIAENTAVILAENGPGMDTLTIGFQAIESRNEACQNLASFRANVMPFISDTNNCMGCHATDNRIFVINEMNDAETCASALQFVNFQDPQSSDFVLIPLNGFGNMDPVPNFADVQNNWIQWIQDEAAANQ
jgi:hypothetical protein